MKKHDKSGLTLRRDAESGIERELTLTPYVEAMFSTGHDAANREVFLKEDALKLNLVGLGIRCPKRA